MIWLVAYCAAIHLAGGVCALGWWAKDAPPGLELKGTDIAVVLAVWPVVFLYGMARGIYSGIRGAFRSHPSPPLTPHNGE